MKCSVQDLIVVVETLALVIFFESSLTESAGNAIFIFLWLLTYFLKWLQVTLVDH